MPTEIDQDTTLEPLVEKAAGDVEQTLGLDRPRARIVAAAGLLGFLVADVGGEVPFTREDATRELDRALDAWMVDQVAKIELRPDEQLTEDQALDRISALADRFPHAWWGKAFAHRLKLERERESGDKITDTTGST
jgi:hypothetical protein